MMLLLPRWVRQRTRPAAHPRFTVYTRSQCCCCHKAVAVLEGFRGRFEFSIEQVDVDSDPALAERYGLTVPVVAVGDKVRFKGVVNPVLLERLLRAESEER